MDKEKQLLDDLKALQKEVSDIENTIKNTYMAPVTKVRQGRYIQDVFITSLNMSWIAVNDTAVKK